MEASSSRCHNLGDTTLDIFEGNYARAGGDNRPGGTTVPRPQSPDCRDPLKRVIKIF